MIHESPDVNGRAEIVLHGAGLHYGFHLVVVGFHKLPQGHLPFFILLVDAQVGVLNCFGGDSRPGQIQVLVMADYLRADLFQVTFQLFQLFIPGLGCSLSDVPVFFSKMTFQGSSQRLLLTVSRK